MLFHQYKTAYDRRHFDNRRMKWQEFYTALVGRGLDGIQKAEASADVEWIKNRRPYYNVFPTITSMLTGVSLDVDCKYLNLPHDPLAVQFAEGKEPCGVDSIMTTRTADKQGRCIVINVDYGGKQKTVTYFPIAEGKTIEERLAALKIEDTEEQVAQMKVALRVVLALCLLDNDPELILPDVLTADKIKWEGGDEDVKRYLEERAKQRGKVGWLVGSSIEVVPHIRRPHLGLRWTGSGRTVPKIVPIKGSLVHRNTVLEIPAGYYDVVMDP